MSELVDIPESFEVLKERINVGIAGNVSAWNGAAARVEHLDHVTEQLVGLVELLVEGFDVLAETAGSLRVEERRLQQDSEGYGGLAQGLDETFAVAARLECAEPSTQVEDRSCADTDRTSPGKQGPVVIKRRLVSMIEHVRADLGDAITAIESDDVDTAIEKLRSISERIRDHVTELRSTQ